MRIPHGPASGGKKGVGIRVLPLGNREGCDFDKESAGLTFEAAEGEAAEVLIKRVSAKP